MSVNPICPVSSVVQVFENPRRHLHSLVGEPGFTMPEQGGLEVYDLDSVEQRALAIERHGLKISIASGVRGNKLALHAGLRLPRLTVLCRGDESVCVVGANSKVSGTIEMQHHSRIVVGGGTAS